MFDSLAERSSDSTIEIAMISMAKSWIAEVQDGSTSRRIPLSMPLVFGSSAAADVRVDDPTVSAEHCEVCVGGGGISIRDLGSKNGTYVGGARIKEAWGTSGTIVVIGETSIVITSEEEAEEEKPGEPLDGIVGGSFEMRRMADQVRRLAQHSVPVLISGETGTGKELISRALHDEGKRREGPFVPINVASLPRDLVESELFGYERGAFTGAVSGRRGAFSEAEGGTLFLDEVGELPIDAQPKLLRALDGYEVRAIGTKSGGRRRNVRVVAATHVPLESAVVSGRFRRDLYHRLEVFVIEVPPLRKRKGDVAALARSFLKDLARDVGLKRLTPGALALLSAHDWPGNVRELRNVLFRAADSVGGGKVIDSAVMERAFRKSREAGLALTPDLARALLEQNDNNLSRAARAAGLPRTSFRKLLVEVSEEKKEK